MPCYTATVQVSHLFIIGSVVISISISGNLHVSIYLFTSNINFNLLVISEISISGNPHVTVSIYLLLILAIVVKSSRHSYLC